MDVDPTHHREDDIVRGMNATTIICQAHSWKWWDGGWLRECMCMHWVLLGEWQWQWPVMLPLYILHPAEHEVMLTPLIIVKVTFL